MKKLLNLTIFIFVLFLIAVSVKSTNAEDIDCNNINSLNEAGLSKCIDQLSDAKAQSEKATKPLEEQIASIRARITFIQNDLVVKEKNIEEGYKNLELQQKILNETIRDYYIKSSYNSPLLLLLSSGSVSELTRVLGYQKATADRDKAIITNIVVSISSLEERKKALESEKINIAAVKEKLDKVVGEAKAYQASLSSTIAQLSARQQEIINARSGGFTVNIGDSELADDYNASIKGFRESAPGGYFGVFSFGAYTHRNGMSQYGALGHVKNQEWGYEQLLKYYYPGVNITDVDVNKTIVVNGTNSYGQSFNNESYNFEDYLKHIYEVPSSWPAEILKAQAIAARSYAYGKNTICPGQNCQEFKREENSDAWKAAVEATRGKVMTGGPGNWQYSSTTGGWVNGLGWDTTDGQGGSNFVDKSFEKIAGSPWVYKAWYTETYRNNSDKCGRSNPWLSPQEMADIVNAAIALKTGGIDTSRITPVTTSCWGGNPYSMDELRNLVSGNGGISSATSVSVSQGNGTTNSVNINGVQLSGDEFKKAFNLRAPGRLSIPQSGFAFYNIEKK